jgi:cell division protein FtsL
MEKVTFFFVLFVSLVLVLFLLFLFETNALEVAREIATWFFVRATLPSSTGGM